MLGTQYFKGSVDAYPDSCEGWSAEELAAGMLQWSKKDEAKVHLAEENFIPVLMEFMHKGEFIVMPFFMVFQLSHELRT